MSYREGSSWNEKNELKCLIIFKKLENNNFPYGEQIEYCREMAKKTDLGVGSISAKVSNYKSVANVNNKSNASRNTIEIYNKYKNISVNEISYIIKKL